MEILLVLGEMLVVGWLIASLLTGRRLEALGAACTLALALVGQPVLAWLGHLVLG